MRLAFSGKGGTGKTAITAMMARVLAASGTPVLVVDLDVNPGLEHALGELDGDGRLPPEAVTRQEGAQYGWGLHPDLTPADAVERFAATGPDGVRMLSLGVIDTGSHDLATTHYAVRQVAQGFDEPGWTVLADMEAGTKDVYDGSYVPFVDRLITITDGSETANLTCRRLASIAERQGGPPVAIVANRAGARLDQAQELADELAVPFAGAIPHDDAVRMADARGTSPYDYAPEGVAVDAVAGLAASLQRLTEEHP